MKIALIGDVHANLPALEAVLADIRKHNVDAIWNTGDFVGYGAFPDEVVKRLRQAKVLSILGNYDAKVLQVKEKKEEWQKTKHPLKYLAFKWTYEQLSKDSRAYLRELPKELKKEVEGKKILLVHGSPASVKEHLTSDTSEKRLRELSKLAKAEVIICGHSHRPFSREVDGVFFVNPGSVGRSEEGDPRACYALLAIKNRFLQANHFRIDYDIQKTVDGLRTSRLPEEFAQMFIKGRSLTEILKEKATGDIFSDSFDSPLNRKQFVKVLDLAKKNAYEAEHSHQVTRLSLMLFDRLQIIHGLKAQHRFLLKCAALLHDIGWINGREGHQKTTFKMILKEKLPFPKRDQLIIALVARSHRKTPPDQRLEEFAKLNSGDRRVVRTLAALLRVADGLDRSHESVVQSVSVRISPKEIVLKCDTSSSAEWDCRTAGKKGDLFEQVFKKKLNVQCRQI